MRTSWSDENAIYLALKCGSNSVPVPHSHLDVGSFVFDRGKTRWALDFGAESYGTIEKYVDFWDLSQGSKCWDIFTYVLTQGDEKLILKVLSPLSGVALKSWSTKAQTNYENPNDGTGMVGFEYTMQAGQRADIVVALLPQAERNTVMSDIKPINEWR